MSEQAQAQVSDETLDELQRLSDAASAGPWKQNGRNGLHTQRGECVALTYSERTRKADAELIAAARNALPSLLAEIERLRARIDGLTFR